MGLPIVERCILRTSTIADFKNVMGKPIGSYSLLEKLSAFHEQVAIQQNIPETDAYPSFRVVDLSPASKGKLTEASTIIVLPPEEETMQPITAVDTAGNTIEVTAEEDTLIRSSLRVTLDGALCGHCAEMGRCAFDTLLVPDGSVIQIGDDEYTCAFTVSPCDGNPWSVYVGDELFRNIRAAYIHKIVAPIGDDDAVIAFSATHFDVPIDFFNPLENSNGEIETLGEPSHDGALCLERLRLCPAVEDFILTNLLGDQYADFLSAILAVGGERHLHGRLLSEGDVVVITVTSDQLLLLSSDARLAAYDTMELVAQLLHHQVNNWDGMWSVEGPDRLGVPFRVVGVQCRAHPASSCGYVYLQSNASSKTMTEIALVSQGQFAWVDSTPLFAPKSLPENQNLGILSQLHQCLSPCLHAGATQDSHTFVVHGIKENLPYHFVSEALLAFGITTITVSGEVLDDDEIRLMLDNFSQSPGHTALLIKNAQHLVAEHPELLSLFELHNEAVGGVRLLFLFCETVEAVAPTLAARATNPEGVISCGNPSEEDRKLLLRNCAARFAVTHNIRLSMLLSFDALSSWTVGLPYVDVMEYMNECVAHICTLQGDDVYPPDVQPVLSELVCEEVLQVYLSAHGHNLVSTKLQPVRWSDVGGLEDAKRELRETIQLPILHPELFANGMKRRTGILFYGPPGCGKTLLAKAVATEMNMNFISVKGPELINQYVGESERNIRLLFQRARDSSPCIVFFDELDALAPARGAKGDAGGAMDRIVSQLLVEVDGVGQSRSDGTTCGEVFIIGATNRPDLLDPSLLRPGRFDRLCYLGIPSTREEQLFALKALTRKFALDADVDFAALLDPMDTVYTGADFFALCSDAMMFSVEEALAKAKAEIEDALQRGDSGDSADASATEDDNEKIQVSMIHFTRARDNLKPSVTREDLRRYEALKSKFTA